MITTSSRVVLMSVCALTAMTFLEGCGAAARVAGKALASGGDDAARMTLSGSDDAARLATGTSDDAYRLTVPPVGVADDALAGGWVARADEGAAGLAGREAARDGDNVIGNLASEAGQNGAQSLFDNDDNRRR